MLDLDVCSVPATNLAPRVRVEDVDHDDRAGPGDSVERPHVALRQLTDHLISFREFGTRHGLGAPVGDPGRPARRTVQGAPAEGSWLRLRAAL
jgi:hypothetical protein